MTSLNVELTELLPSPLFSYLWNDSELLNRQLREVILEEEKKSPGLLTSNAGGWHSEKSLQEWDRDCIRTLLARIITFTRESVLCTIELQEYSEEVLGGWTVQAWANVNRSGHFNKYHHHIRNSNLWSGVYYVDAGDGGRPNFVGARIVFADQHRPELKDHPSLAARHAIMPKSGLMLLFPSSLGHRVEPYNGSTERITIAFNLRHEKFTTLNYEIEKKQAAKKAHERSIAVALPLTSPEQRQS